MAERAGGPANRGERSFGLPISVAPTMRSLIDDFSLRPFAHQRVVSPLAPPRRPLYFHPLTRADLINGRAPLWRLTLISM